MLQTHCATLCYSCTRPVAAISPSLRRLSSRSKAASVCNPLPASFLRGGTSKGIFINRAHLPADTTLSKNIFLGLMGSPDSYGRQLNGMGGGISSLSKICIVGTPSPEQSNMGVAVEYTFVQIGLTVSCANETQLLTYAKASRTRLSTIRAIVGTCLA